MTMNSLPLALALLSLTACGLRQKPETSTDEATSVTVANPLRLREAQRVAVSGSVVSPDNPAGVAFLVAGKVIQVVPREGDAVQKGQVLAVVDPADYSLGVEAAAAQVAMARAVLQKAESPVRPELLEQARVNYERTRDEFARLEMLYNARSLPPNDFQKAKAALDVARQQFEQAKAGGQKEDRDQARAALDQAIASEKMAQKRLADTTLRAPSGGFIASRAVEPGDTAAPGRPVFMIVQIDPVEVQAGVPERDVRLVRVGQSAEITIPALPGEAFTGTVRVINVAADPSTRTYMVRIRVPNPRRILRVGMIAEASIRGAQMIDVLTVPTQAVVRDPQGAASVFVYFRDQQRVYAKRVEVGTLRGTQIEVRSGLTENQTVVVGGQERLRDGVRVEAKSL